uniref:Uncharacterized protein n=1 Tax=Arundo donax TaxID=35708 RepID=A0A0A9DE95_ARUDO
MTSIQSIRNCSTDFHPAVECIKMSIVNHELLLRTRHQIYLVTNQSRGDNLYLLFGHAVLEQQYIQYWMV